MKDQKARGESAEFVLKVQLACLPYIGFDGKFART
jgi:hypothetical protein